MCRGDDDDDHDHDDDDDASGREVGHNSPSQHADPMLIFCMWFTVSSPLRRAEGERAGPTWQL